MKRIFCLLSLVTLDMSIVSQAWTMPRPNQRSRLPQLPSIKFAKMISAMGESTESLNPRKVMAEISTTLVVVGALLGDAPLVNAADESSTIAASTQASGAPPAVVLVESASPPSTPPRTITTVAAPVTATPPPTILAAAPVSSTTVEESLLVPEQAAPAVTVQKAEQNVEKEEKELVAELKKDRADEVIEQKETDKLITELENQQTLQPDPKPAETTTVAAASPASPAPAPTTTEQLITQLEKDEEKVEKETLVLIEKVKDLQAVEQAEISADKAASDMAKAQQTEQEATDTKEFLKALETRSSDTEDLIAKLKERSKGYYNPKTGRYDNMSKDDFVQRAKTFNRENDVLLEALKVREKSTEEFMTEYNKFLGSLQTRLSSIVGEG